jgi:hypothetical protein
VSVVHSAAAAINRLKTRMAKSAADGRSERRRAPARAAGERGSRPAGLAGEAAIRESEIKRDA